MHIKDYAKMIKSTKKVMKYTKWRAERKFSGVNIWKVTAQDGKCRVTLFDFIDENLAKYLVETQPSNMIKGLEQQKNIFRGWSEFHQKFSVPDGVSIHDWVEEIVSDRRESEYIAQECINTITDIVEATNEFSGVDLNSEESKKAFSSLRDYCITKMETMFHTQVL